MKVSINTDTGGILEGEVDLNLAELNSFVAAGEGMIHLVKRKDHNVWSSTVQKMVMHDAHYDIAARHVVWVRTLVEPGQ